MPLSLWEVGGGGKSQGRRLGLKLVASSLPANADPA